MPDVVIDAENVGHSCCQGVLGQRENQFEGVPTSAKRKWKYASGTLQTRDRERGRRQCRFPRVYQTTAWAAQTLMSSIAVAAVSLSLWGHRTDQKK